MHGIHYTVALTKLEHYLRHVENAQSLLKQSLPSKQRVNLQMLYHPILKVCVTQLLTLPIISMHKLCLGKIFFLVTPLEDTLI